VDTSNPTCQRSVKLDSVTRKTFEPLRGSRFLIRDNWAPPAEVELVDVCEFRTNKADVRPLTSRKPFSIFFRGSSGHSLEQGTYPVEHETLGTFELFLVPVGPEQDGLVLEAAFA
jgi:hypothetical protein